MRSTGNDTWTPTPAAPVTPATPEPAVTPQTRDLDRSLVRGIAWTGGGKWLTQIVSWIATPIIASLLSPADYGVAGMAMVYIGLVQLVTEFGIGVAIVQRRDITDDQVARLGTVSLMLGVTFAAVSVAVAPVIAAFFGNADVESVIMVLSVIFIVGAVQSIPRALLARELSFRRLAMLDALEALATITVTLPLAAMGFRHWAIVLGAIGGRVASTILALVWRRHRLTWPAPLHTVAGSIRFGSHVVGSSLGWYVYLNADLAIIGRRLGNIALGSYALGVTLAGIPVERLSALIARVTPAILAKVQHDPTALRRYVLGLTEGTALLTFPTAVGLALVAREFVLVVLGEDWRPAIVPLRILAIAAVFRSLTPLFGQVLWATGASRRNMTATFATAVVLVPLFYIGSQWGTAGVALVWLVAFPVVCGLSTMRYALEACDMRIGVYLQALWPAASATLVMTAVVLAVAMLLPPSWPLVALLVAKCAVGGATYVGLVWYLHGDRLRRSLALVRGRGVTQGVA